MVSGVDGADYTVREMLIRMEGKIDVITDNQRTNEDVRALRQQHHDMNGRIAVVEATHNQAIGEKRGFNNALRAIYTLCAITGLSTLPRSLRRSYHWPGGIKMFAIVLLLTIAALAIVYAVFVLRVDLGGLIRKAIGTSKCR
jgi:hypothetical protein